jgi:hypothetical protein
MDVVTYILAKGYTDNVLVNSEGLAGKSAYEIAVENGFVGSEEEWLKSLSPYIGENGHWYLNGVDLGVNAEPELEDYHSKEDLVSLTSDEILDICQ